MDRREFVRLVGLASGASLLSSCGLERQTEKLIPYVFPPDDGIVPGKSVFYKTTCTECPANCGMTARVIDGRVVKLEGIGSHPVSDGALCVRGQASIARVYHPERLHAPLVRGTGGAFREASWEEGYGLLTDALGKASPDGARRTHAFLSGRVAGTLSELIDDFCGHNGIERLPEFELFSYAAIREADRILFGLEEVPAYRIEEADWMLTLGADLFETMTSPVSHAVQFGRVKRRGGFHWVHVEPHYSLTGAQADERYSIAAGSEVYLLSYLLREASRANLVGERRIAELVEQLPHLSSRAAAERTGLSVELVEDVARGLLSAESPLVIAGGVSTMQRGGLDAALLTGLLQWSTGMIGRTVRFEASRSFARTGSLKSLESLSERLAEDRIGVLIFCETDPLGTVRRPVGSAALENLGTNLRRAGLRAGFGDFMNPTLEACDVVLPISHSLESWGDARPNDLIHSIIQPAVEPIHDTASVGDILLELDGRLHGAPSRGTYQEMLIAKLRDTYGPDGVAEMMARGYTRVDPPERAVALNSPAALSHLRETTFGEPAVDRVLVVSPSIRHFDARGRRLALLDEVPDPLTTVSYGGWASVSRTTAEELGVADREEAALSGAGWTLEVPLKEQPGLQRNVFNVHFTAMLPLPIAVDARCGELVAVHEGVKVRGTGRKALLPVLSGSLSQRGRGVIGAPEGGHGGHEGTHGEHGKHGAGGEEGDHPSFYPELVYKDYRWAMAVDLDLCIGCSACVAACYIENNVPVTGPRRHLEGREMSWLRVEPFYDEEGRLETQLMLCQHCGNAPCETVCPVYAAYHNPEGLNAQIYNRCVGTRYCANNCPYKVRRFNWFDFKRPTAANPTVNPEVSVRGRGIMEKCTFCVQRIRAARENAKNERRKILEGEVVPACAQTCPTGAIVFGNLKDENSAVSKWAASDRVFRVFDFLGTDPAIYYLKTGWKTNRA